MNNTGTVNRIRLNAKAALCIAVAACASQAVARTETHPFIHYTGGTVAAVMERLDREPYASWRTRLLDAADDALAAGIAWDAADTAEETKAYYARNLAFASVVSDSLEENRGRWRGEALTALANLPSGGYGGVFSSDLAVSEAAMYWAETYDILKGDGADFNLDGYGDIEPTVRARFRALRDYMARDEYELFSSGGIANDFTSAAYNGDDAMDNHHVKLHSALSVLSASILDESGSQADLDHALSRLAAGLRTMTVTGDDGSPAGGWAEGPEYQRYSAQQYLTAAVALKNLGVADLWADIPELAETDLLLPLMVMPDGYLPPFDDNHAVTGDMAGLLYSAYAGRNDRDLLHWLWERSGSTVKNAFLVDYLARFDDTAPAYASPDDMGLTPSVFRPESGFGVFRDSWESDGVYLFLLSEHGEARTNGRAHEHPDPNAILVHAYGEQLLLDSGYGGWNAHDATRHARNHNLILVNGEGPSGASQPFGFGTWQANGADAFLKESFTSGDIDYAVSETLYQNTSFRRHIVFPGHRFFFVYDDLLSGAEATFTLLLHGNGGGSSGGTFTETGGGAVWERGQASLESFTIGTSGPLTFAREDMQHAVYDRTLLTHTVLEVSQTGKTARYLTALFPFPSGEDAPQLREAAVENGAGIGLDTDDGAGYGCVRDGDGSMRLDEGGVRAETDAEFLYAASDGDGGLGRFFLIDGGFLASGEDTLITLSRPSLVSLDLSGQLAASGYVHADSATTVTLHERTAERVTFGGTAVEFSIEDNNLVFTIEGSGALQVVFDEPPYRIDPPVDVVVTDPPDDYGHRLYLTWSPSPSEDIGLVNVYRIFRSRSEDLSDAAPMDSFETIEALNSWESRHTVLVDSVAAGVGGYLDDRVPMNNEPYYYWLQAVGDDGVSEKVAAHRVTGVSETPAVFAVDAPFPNPFNAATTIRYRLPGESRVTLTVFDTRGGIVRRLVDGRRGPGYHEAVWNGAGDSGERVASGLYLFRIEAAGVVRYGKLTLVK